MQTNITEPGQDRATLSWSYPIATDNSNQEPSISCDSRPGSTFPIGQTQVHCTAEDASGNSAKCEFDVKVIGKQS